MGDSQFIAEILAQNGTLGLVALGGIEALVIETNTGDTLNGEYELKFRVESGLPQNEGVTFQFPVRVSYSPYNPDDGGSKGLPGWAIALIVVGSLLLVGAVIALVISLKKIRIAKAESVDA